jgi:hypothetical protein
MTPAEHYRMYATIAVDMAADAANADRRVSLLAMAQEWRRLADKAEGPQQVVQQQQQPQPDNENDK